MIINNFPLLEDILRFEPGTYYKFVALIRQKDFADNTPVLNVKERSELFVRQWFVDSEESLERYAYDMINLCTATKARLYMTTDRKSVKKTILKMQDQLSEYVKQIVNNPDAPISIRKLSKFSSSASQMAECSSGPKYWLIDIDGNDIEESKRWKVALLLSDYFKTVLSLKHSNIATFKTPNGYHLLVPRDFDIYRVVDSFLLTGHIEGKLGNETISIKEDIEGQCRVFLTSWRKQWEIKENALTLVYFNDGK